MSADYFPVRLEIGTLQRLTEVDIERLSPTFRRPYKRYYYRTVGKFRYESVAGKIVTIPEGYLTDGSSGGPDIGWSWLFHDYLYSSHFFDDGTRCSRKEADLVLLEILRSERLYLYRSLVRLVLALEFLHGMFEKSWFDGGFRGPEYFSSDDSEGDVLLDDLDVAP